MRVTTAAIGRYESSKTETEKSGDLASPGKVKKKKKTGNTFFLYLLRITGRLLFYFLHALVRKRIVSRTLE